MTARHRLAVGLTAVVALTVRLLHVLSYDPRPAGRMIPFVDMAIRRLSWENLFRPEGLGSVSPGYPIFLKLLFALLPRSAEWAGIRVAQAALGAVTCLLVYRLARRLHSRRAGMIAALLCCFHAHYVFFSSAYLAENLFIPAFLTALLTMLRARQRGGPRRLLVAGIAWGGALLVHPAAAALLPAAVAALRGGRRGEGVTPPLRAAGLIMGGALLLLGPWTLRTWIASGSPSILPAPAAWRLAMAFNPDSRGRSLPVPSSVLTDPGEARSAAREASRFISEDPWGAIYQAGRLKWRAFWEGNAPWPLGSHNPSLFAGGLFFPTLSWRIVLFTGLAGLGLLLASRASPAPVTLGCALLFAGLYLIAAGEARSRLALEALFLAWAGAGIAAVAGSLPGPVARRGPAWPAAIVLILAAILGEVAVAGMLVRGASENPGRLTAAGGRARISPGADPEAVFSGGIIPLDRSRGAYLSLTMAVRRGEGGEGTAARGRIAIEFIHVDGDPHPWIGTPTLELDSLPAGAWVPVEIRAHVPPSATGCRVEASASGPDGGTIEIEGAELRLGAGNSPALEFIFPYLVASE